jgi:oligoendopeptidase F
LLPEHQFDWARVGHLFFRPFYCYSYTLSFVVALACYQQYLQQGKEFVPRYLKLLDTGGSLSPDQALQLVGIDLNDPLTVSQALDYTESLIEQLEEELEE